MTYPSNPDQPQSGPYGENPAPQAGQPEPGQQGQYAPPPADQWSAPQFGGPSQNPYAPPNQNPAAQDPAPQQPAPPQPYAQPDPAQYGQSQYGQPQSGQAQSGQAQSGQAQSGQAQSGQAQYGQAQYGQPQSRQAQYGQPQYGQSQYGQPQSGQAPYGQPQSGQAQYGQPQYAPPGAPAQAQYGPGQYGQPVQAGWTPTEPAKASGRGGKKAILAAAVAVVVVAGGAVSYVAFQDKNTGGGAGSPQAAVATIVTSLSKSDLLGVLDDLPPGERASIHDSFVSQVSQLKRLKVLNSSADVNKVSGVTFAAKGLTYGSSVVVNDHVQLVTVTGGTISVNSDASKVPYTKEFLDAAFDGKTPTQSQSQTIDIAAETAQSGEPLRIAVQKVSGKWYPSLMYTVIAAAANSDHLGIPTAADAIAPLGASSADDAVRQMITAASKQDYQGIIALLDPNEDAAVHDYGNLLLKSAPRPTNASFDLKNITFTDSTVTGGTRVSLHSVQFTSNGEDVTVTIDGQCASIASGATTTKTCALQALDKYGASLHLTAAQRAALGDLFAAIPKIGVVSTKSGGKWYISPIRTYSDLDTSILGNLKDNDLLTLIELARKH